MLRRNLVLYLASRGFAALSNLLAVAIFSRLAGPDIYGHYVVMFAAALVVGGFSVQWIRYAFFAHYQSDEDSDFFASFVVLICASIVVTIAVTALAFKLAGVDMVFGAGAVLIGLATGLFEVTIEVCRTRLEAGRAAFSTSLKAALVLVFGTLALWWHTSALALAGGIAAAHLAAALPAVLRLHGLFGGRPNWTETRKLVTFGWPLMLSFGIGAFAQGIDRFFLAGVAGAAAIGAYGALSDLVRASFTVLGESISLATIPLAKRQFSDGDRAGATQTLHHAYRLLLLVGALLTSGFVVMAPVLLPIVLPPAFLQDSVRLLPPILLASFLLVMRNVYLAQIIYFARASHLELLSALILTAVNAALCLVLIPRYGALGAAWAFLGGQVASGSFFLAQRRRGFAMPTPLVPLVGMVLLGTALSFAGIAIDRLGLALLATLGAQSLLFAGALAVAALGFGIRPRDLLRGGVSRLAVARR